MWFRGNQKQTPPLFTKGQIFDPICFCYYVLGPHSFDFNFYGIYCEQYLCFGHCGFRLCIVCPACADRKLICLCFLGKMSLWKNENKWHIWLRKCRSSFGWHRLIHGDIVSNSLCHSSGEKKKASSLLELSNFWAQFIPCVRTGMSSGLSKKPL